MTENNADLAEERHHTDEREPLGYAYEGEELVAILYKKKALQDIEESNWLDLVRTPEGEVNESKTDKRG